MAKDNVDVVQGAWDAFARGDIDGAVEGFAPNAERGDGDGLIVVDNASTGGTPDAVREGAAGATVGEEGKNLGFAAASSRGAAVSSGDLLLFLNPDAVVAPGFRDGIELPLT